MKIIAGAVKTKDDGLHSITLEDYPDKSFMYHSQFKKWYWRFKDEMNWQEVKDKQLIKRLEKLKVSMSSKASEDITTRATKKLFDILYADKKNIYSVEKIDYNKFKVEIKVDGKVVSGIVEFKK